MEISYEGRANISCGGQLPPLASPRSYATAIGPEDKFAKDFNEVVEKSDRISNDLFHKLTLPGHKRFESVSASINVKSKYGQMYYQLNRLFS